MDDDLIIIPIEEDDFEDIEAALFGAEDGAAAAIAEMKRLREDLAAALGFASYEWHKAPHEIRAALETMDECLSPLADNLDYALRKLLRAKQKAELAQEGAS